MEIHNYGFLSPSALHKYTPSNVLDEITYPFLIFNTYS